MPALVVLIGGAGFFVGNWLHAEYFTRPDPVQPIDFNHRIHVQDNQIPCLYCHVQAERAQVASVPPVSKCMGCHQVIAEDSPEVVRLSEYWENQEPIPWVKVYNVPDFVHFTHARHVAAGVACQTCHGQVESMERVERVHELSMTMCVECHTAHEVARGRDCWVCHK